MKEPIDAVQRSKSARVRRSFTHCERVNAILMLDSRKGASIRAVARQLDIPETTLRRWKSGERSPEAKADAPQHREQLAEVFERAVWECLAMSLDTLHTAKYLHLMQGAGLAVDAMLALRKAAFVQQASAHVGNAAALTTEQLELLLAVLDAAKDGPTARTLSALSAGQGAVCGAIPGTTVPEKKTPRELVSLAG